MLQKKIAIACKNAWDAREEAYYTNEFGRAAVGMCRRVSYDDGTAQMWGDVNTANFVSLEGGNDSGIELFMLLTKIKSLQVLLQILHAHLRFWSKEALFLQISGDEQKQFCVKSLEKTFIC